MLRYTRVAAYAGPFRSVAKTQGPMGVGHWSCACHMHSANNVLCSFRVLLDLFIWLNMAFRGRAKQWVTVIDQTIYWLIGLLSISWECPADLSMWAVRCGRNVAWEYRLCIAVGAKATSAACRDSVTLRTPAWKSHLLYLGSICRSYRCRNCRKTTCRPKVTYIGRTVDWAYVEVLH